MNWLHRLSPERPTAPVLLAFPFAGGGPAVFSSWASDPRVELHAVCLPGRDRRLRESPTSDLPAIIAALAAAVGRFAPQRLLILHGHSAGAHLAAHMAHHLEAAGRPPRLLSLAALRGPGAPVPAPLSGLSSERLWEELERRFGRAPGGPTPLELRPLVEPALRADLAMIERGTSPPGCSCPTLFLTAADDVSAGPALMDPWLAWACGPARLVRIAGDHWSALSATSLDELLAR